MGNQPLDKPSLDKETIDTATTCRSLIGSWLSGTTIPDMCRCDGPDSCHIRKLTYDMEAMDNSLFDLLALPQVRLARQEWMRVWLGLTGGEAIEQQEEELVEHLVIEDLIMNGNPDAERPTGVINGQ